jgi:hypothetical protein
MLSFDLSFNHQASQEIKRGFFNAIRNSYTTIRNSSYAWPALMM